MVNTRHYMLARLELANYIHDKIAVVHKTEHEASWRIVQWHYQEMLRLCSRDNLGLRFRFPFLLLHLNRDDDAFCFIRHWVRDDDEEDNDDDEGCTRREKLHKESKEGEWIYGEEKDSRFLDIFQSGAKEEDMQYGDLALVVALACIKMRIVATDAPQKAKQSAQLDRIIGLIHKYNPTMLPALMDPQPLLSQTAPDYTSPGKPSECYSIVQDATPTWRQIPGALQVLQDRFGRKPKYDCNMSL